MYRRKLKLYSYTVTNGFMTNCCTEIYFAFNEKLAYLTN